MAPHVFIDSSLELFIPLAGRKNGLMLHIQFSSYRAPSWSGNMEKELLSHKMRLVPFIFLVIAGALVVVPEAAGHDIGFGGSTDSLVLSSEFMTYHRPSGKNQASLPGK